MRIIISYSFKEKIIFFILSGEFGREPNGKSNHAISPGCLALALENISRQALGVAEISFQTSEPNTRTGSAVSLHGPAISLCLLPVEFSANYAVFVIRIWAASLSLVNAEYIRILDKVAVAKVRITYQAHSF